MKPLSFLLCALTLAGSVSATEKNKIPKEIRTLVPKRIDIDSPAYQSSKAELEDLVAQCGAGVVKGAVDNFGKSLENTCSFQVELDALFFEGPETKMGLLNEADWAYQDGVQWFIAPEREIPEKFDLRDLMAGGIPDIRKQECGDCWAWASHHGHEIARAVKEGKVTDHSIQAILSCSRKGTCNGGYMSAVDFILRGLPEEPQFPYVGYDKACKYNSSELQTGWSPKMNATPWVGDSKRYSLAMRTKNGGYREGTKVKEMMNAMYDAKGPLVVTVAAYSISGNGIYNACSAINSGGNHMVTIVGWDSDNGRRNAHVWNSWGKSHGLGGVSRIQWECGEGRLNRGLGVSAKVVKYQPSCVAPDASQKYLREIKKGDSVEIGVQGTEGVTCQWTPTAGLSDSTSCNPIATPNISTEYHLSMTNACGTSSSMTLVNVWGVKQTQKSPVLTPHGIVFVENQRLKH